MTTTIIGVNEYENIVHAYDLDSASDSDRLAEYLTQRRNGGPIYDSFYYFENGQFRTVEILTSRDNAYDRDAHWAEYTAKVYSFSGELLHVLSYSVERD